MTDLNDKKGQSDMESKEVIIQILMAVVMVICAAIDIKKKTIPVWIFAVLGIVALTGGICCESCSFYRAAAGVIPGVLLLGLAKVTEQSIGYGDGIVLAEMGSMLGAGVCMVILAGALALAGFFSIGMMTVKKVDKRYKIPFIPFLTIAYIITLCLQGGWV